MNLDLLHRGKKTALISNHHGHIDKENNLEAATPLIRAHTEIDIVEVDFIHYRDALISAHDHDATQILNGSGLEEWIQLVVIEQKRILWIDMKARMDWMAFFVHYSEETARLLMRKLNKLQRRYIKTLDLRHWIMITCQDHELNALIQQYNRAGWEVVADVPFAWSYFFKWYMPQDVQGWVDEYVYDYFTERYDFTPYAIVSIDVCFFNNDLREVLRFLKHTNIKKDAFIVLYNFKQGTPPVTLQGYNVITQYDFNH